MQRRRQHQQQMLQMQMMRNEMTGGSGGAGGVLFVGEDFFFSSSSPLPSSTTSASFLVQQQQLQTSQQPLDLLGPGLVVAILLLLLILCCVIGNLFVITAVLVERDLRSRPQYYLIFSLAIADLMVGLIVTPLGAWNTLRQSWELGVTLCDFWISVDVLVCTSSILHLVAIALDRYWSVTNIYYTNNRTPKRIFSMLLIIWVVSLLISLAPQFGLKDENFVSRVREQQICLISQDIAYQVFSTSTAFYIPLCAIVLIYYKIMRAAKKRFQRERDRRTVNRTLLDEAVPPKATKLLISQNSQNSPTVLPPMGRHSQPNCAVMANNNNFVNRQDFKQQNGHFKVKLKLESAQPLTPTNAAANQSTTENGDEEDEENEVPLTTTAANAEQQCCVEEEEVVAETVFSDADGTIITNGKKRKSRSASQLLAFPRPILKRVVKKKRGTRESVETRRERKAWRTLAIITGTFIACWTPFFILSLYRPICINLTHKGQCESIPALMEQIFNWLGYLNSALNPIIYTIFSLDFRLAFERILRRIFCRYR